MSLFDMFKPGYVQPIIKSQTDDIEYLWCSGFDPKDVADILKGPYEIEVHVDQLSVANRKMLLSTLVKLYDQGEWKRVGTPGSAFVKNKIGRGDYAKQLLVRWKGSYTLIYEMDDSGCKEMHELMRKYGTISYYNHD